MSATDPEIAEAARAIVAHHLGGEAGEAQTLGGGLSNRVFRVTCDGRPFIVRLGEAGGKTEAFLKEHWATARAAEAGVPVVRILQVGSDVIDMPYMIEDPASGHPAELHPDRIGVYRQLGELAARIHTIETHGFGDTFDWSQNALSRCESWPEFLTDDFAYSSAIDTLASAGVIDAAQQQRLNRAFETLSKEQPVAALNHGDLRLKNVFVDDAGVISALIDWEECQSNAPRLWELSIMLHDLGVDDKQAILEGYGLKPQEAETLRLGWTALNVANYARFAAAAVENNDKDKLGWMRARLAGSLDLYAL